jgi:hypothetical protein
MLNMEKTGLPMKNFPAKYVSSKGNEMHRSCKDTNIERGENVSVVGCYYPIYLTLPIVTSQGLRVLESHKQNLSIE